MQIAVDRGGRVLDLTAEGPYDAAAVRSLAGGAVLSGRHRSGRLAGQPPHLKDDERVMVQRRRSSSALGAAGLAAAGCSSPSQANGDAGEAQHPAAGRSGSAVGPPISLTVSPVAGTAHVSPADPVTVSVDGGKLRVGHRRGRRKSVERRRCSPTA